VKTQRRCLALRFMTPISPQRSNVRSPSHNDFSTNCPSLTRSPSVLERGGEVAEVSCAGEAEHSVHRLHACRDGRDDGGARSLDSTRLVHDVDYLLCPASCLDCAWRWRLLFGRHLTSLSSWMMIPACLARADAPMSVRGKDGTTFFFATRRKFGVPGSTAGPCYVPRTTCPVAGPMRKRQALLEVRSCACAWLRKTAAAPVSLACLAWVGLAQGEGVFSSRGVTFTLQLLQL
jgi:hypothetical protein